jgi:predicted transcriptional regulator
VTVEDTWGARDVPVLKTAVALLEQSYMVTVSDIAERTGLELAEVARSLEAMDPTYVDFRKTETGGDPRFWYVYKVTPAARQQVGQWPTAESLVDRLAMAFSEAADRETDPDQQERLRMAARLVGGTVRAAAIEVAASVVGEAAGRASATGDAAVRDSAVGNLAIGDPAAGDSTRAD